MFNNYKYLSLKKLMAQEVYARSFIKEAGDVVPYLIFIGLMVNLFLSSEHRNYHVGTGQ